MVPKQKESPNEIFEEQILTRFNKVKEGLFFEPFVVTLAPSPFISDVQKLRNLVDDYCREVYLSYGEAIIQREIKIEMKVFGGRGHPELVCVFSFYCKIN